MFNLITITFAFKYASLANINQGVILTLCSLTAVYNVVIFRLLFNERVSTSQLTGIMFMIACVILIGLSTGSAPSEQTEESAASHSNAIIAISFSFLSPLFLSLKHIFIRTYKK